MPLNRLSEWVAIQRNPTSGSGVGREELVRLVLSLQKFGYQVRLFKDRDKLLRTLNDPERRSLLKCLVAAGGDGTVNDVLNRYPSVPISLCSRWEPKTCSPSICRSPIRGNGWPRSFTKGRTEKFDLCEVNGRKFLLMASFGIDAEVVHRTSEARTGKHQ